MDDWPTWRTHPWQGLAFLLFLIIVGLLVGIAGAGDMQADIARHAL